MAGMSVGSIDVVIVVAYVVVTVIVGLLLSRKATTSVDHYFVGGRSLPWWLAGTSMVASAFAIDTPLGITGLVAEHGIQGVWFAWAFAIGGAGAFNAFVFAPLLRRSEILTSAELVELRYGGRGAAILRGFKGVYFGVLAIAVSMGWVLKSVVVICQNALGWDALPTLSAIVLITIVYTTASGFIGVAVTDFAQFFIGAIGSVALAYYAMDSVGGADGLVEGLQARYGVTEAARRLQFVPRFDDAFFHVFLVMVTIKWWGNAPAAITQRVMSTKDERHATFASLMFATMQFAVNYWPMILTALVSLARYPEYGPDEAGHGYAKLLVSVLPTGVLGLTLASATAAFMSTVDTQANTGASFMVNDLYRRFLVRNGSDAHYVRASQVCTVLMILLALCTYTMMSTVRDAWKQLATMIAGYGFVTVARWFWWRINAWSELASLAGSAVGSSLIHVSRVAEFTGLAARKRAGLPTFGLRFGLVAATSIISFILVSFLTPPESPETLRRFCKKVRPYPALWGPVRRSHADIVWSPYLARNVFLWFVGVAGIFSVCFGIGHVLLGSSIVASGLFAIAAVCLAVILKIWRR